MRHVVVVEAGTLRTEQHAGAEIARADLVQFGGRAASGQHRLDDVTRPRTGGEHVVQIGDRICNRGEHPRGIQDTIGT